MRPLPSLCVFVVLLAGCAGGPDGLRAQELLSEARAAEAKLSSAEYAARTSFSIEGQQFGLELEGAVVLRGTGAGDQWLRMTSDSVPGAGEFAMTMVRRGSRLTITSAGQTQELPVPDELGAGGWASLSSLDLASCVERVDVEEGRRLNGQAATRIAGVIDTVCAFEAVNAASSFGQARAVPDLDALRDHLRDARATLFVSPRSHLLIGGVIELGAEFDGRELSFEVSYRLKRVNVPVRFPS